MTAAWGVAPSMLRQNPRAHKRSNLRAAVIVGLVLIGICSLLAINPFTKGRTRSLLTAHGRALLTNAIARDDSQVARDQAIALGLVPKGRFPINKGDLVSAMPSDQSHLQVVKGSRAWRKVQTCCQPCWHCYGLRRNAACAALSAICCKACMMQPAGYPHAHCYQL